MRVSSRRGLLVAALVCTLAPLAAGCGADFTAGTRLVRPDTPEAELGALKIRHPVIVADAEGDRAVLTVAIINEGGQPETLSGVAVEGAGQVQAAGGTTITIPARGAVFIGSAGGPAITITRQGGKPAPGEFAELTLSFASAGEVRIQVAVRPPTGEFASLTPSPVPTPTGTPGGTQSPTGTASPTGTPLPGATGEESPGTGVEEGENSTSESPTATPGG